ncbi:flavodoxin family protein [Pelomyxa schiedti]|nr:flavodoxin family protein [Pelomyxa schiedti]
MKVLVVVGSPRVGKSTDFFADCAIAAATERGAEVEKVYLHGKHIGGCTDCHGCRATGRAMKCVLNDDMNAIYPKIVEADIIIHATPVYFWSMTAQMKSYMDRWTAFYNESWAWHDEIAERMKAKKIGVIATCGDTDTTTCDPAIDIIKKTCTFSGMKYAGEVKISTYTSIWTSDTASINAVRGLVASCF